MTQSPKIEEQRPANQPVMPPEPPEGENIGTFYAFRYVNYRLLWLGDLFTAAANWMMQTATAWVVLQLTGTGQAVGTVNLMRLFPTLLLSPVAGVVTDRYSRNKIILLSQFSMLICTFLIASDIALGTVEVWHLYLFTIALGAGQNFNMPARQTLVFELVPRRVIPNAIALSWFAFSTSRAVGPALGGVLIAVIGPAENFYIQALAYLSVMATIVFLRVPPRTMPARKSFFQSLREGYGFVWNDPRARVMLLMSTLSPFFIIPLHQSLLPLFAVRDFHQGSEAFGILAASVGFGGLFGGLLTASLNRIERRGIMQLIALFIFSLSETAFSILAAVTGNIFLCTPLLIIAGCAESLYTTTNTSVLQLLAPEHLRGSMASVLQLSFLLVPIGAMIAGWAADYFGAPAVGATMTFTAFSIGFAVLLFSKEMRSMTLSDLTKAQEKA